MLASLGNINIVNSQAGILCHEIHLGPNDAERIISEKICSPCTEEITKEFRGHLIIINLTGTLLGIRDSLTISSVGKAKMFSGMTPFMRPVFRLY